MVMDKILRWKEKLYFNALKLQNIPTGKTIVFLLKNDALII